MKQNKKIQVIYERLWVKFPDAERQGAPAAGKNGMLCSTGDTRQNKQSGLDVLPILSRSPRNTHDPTCSIPPPHTFSPSNVTRYESASRSTCLITFLLPSCSNVSISLETCLTTIILIYYSYLSGVPQYFQFLSRQILQDS